MKKAVLALSVLILIVCLFSSCTAVCAHDYLGEVTLDPTCETLGKKHLTCSLCADAYDMVLSEYWHTAGADGRCIRCREKIAREEDLVFELFEDETFYLIAGTQASFNHDQDIIIPSYINGMAVKSIGENAFANAYFRSIKLAPTIEFIRNGAFTNTIGLKSILLSRGLYSIGEDAFNGSFVESITMYSGVVDVKANAFANCICLTTINYHGTEEQFAKINIADGNDCFKNAKINYITE